MGETIEQVTERYKNINFMALPELSKRAINKLEADNSDELLKVLLVLAIAEGDTKLAEGVLDENKTLSTCNKHIYNWARKKAVGNQARIDHEEVLSEAIHYFLDVEEKPFHKPLPQPIEPVEIEVPEEDDGTMSLFDDDECGNGDMGSLFGDDEID